MSRFFLLSSAATAAASALPRPLRPRSKAAQHNPSKPSSSPRRSSPKPATASRPRPAPRPTRSPSKDIEAQPGGDNTLLNQVMLQAPGVAQDSFGQLHVRGEHNGLQYRLNGIIIPEGISVFGQTLDPRLAGSREADHRRAAGRIRLRTAGIIDVQTKTGCSTPGGDRSDLWRQPQRDQAELRLRRLVRHFNYFVSGDYMTNTLGIESPDGSSDPLHDRTKQWHGFAFLQDILDQNSSVTAILGTSNDMFQIPNSARPAAVGHRRHRPGLQDRTGDSC